MSHAMQGLRACGCCSLLLILAAGIAAQQHAEPLLPGLGELPHPPRVTDASGELLYWTRIAKCKRLADQYYPNSGFASYAAYFIMAHERAGMGDQWQWSMAYGGANIGLRCHYRARNGCSGPMDRPGGPIDPRANIDAHIREMLEYYPREKGYQLMKRVFYPMAPRDWGGRRIWKTYHKHVRIIESSSCTLKCPVGDVSAKRSEK